MCKNGRENGRKKGLELVLVVKRGGRPLDGKNFDLPPSPGHEFRPEGTSVLYGHCSVSIASHDR